MYASGLHTDPGLRKAAQAARMHRPHRSRPVRSTSSSMASRCRFTERPTIGAPPLRLAVQTFRNEALDGHAATMRWLSLYSGRPVDGGVRAVGRRRVPSARHPRRGTCPRYRRAARTPRCARHSCQECILFSGEFAAAAAAVQEAEAIAAATGNADAAVRRPRPRRLARRRSRSSGAHRRRYRKRDGTRRGDGSGYGRLLPQRARTTAWLAMRRRSRASTLATTTMGHIGCGTRRARRGGDPFWQGRSSPPPRCRGWRSAPTPPTRIGRSESSRAHGL